MGYCATQKPFQLRKNKTEVLMYGRDQAAMIPIVLLFIVALIVVLAPIDPTTPLGQTTSSQMWIYWVVSIPILLANAVIHALTEGRGCLLGIINDITAVLCLAIPLVSSVLLGLAISLSGGHPAVIVIFFILFFLTSFTVSGIISDISFEK